jgi:uncharacterized protein (DUF433 family)
MVESNKGIFGGEHVLKGARIPVRMIAELIRKGVSEAEIEEDLEVTSEQIKAAVIFHQTAPRRRRPRIRRINVTVISTGD